MKLKATYSPLHLSKKKDKTFPTVLANMMPSGPSIKLIYYWKDNQPYVVYNACDMINCCLYFEKDRSRISIDKRCCSTNLFFFCSFLPVLWTCQNHQTKELKDIQTICSVFYSVLFFLKIPPFVCNK
jgi:hypothetical protein